MATDGENDEDEDDEPVNVPQRSISRLRSRESLPSVESSLDAFITKANEKLFDVANVKSESREDALQREVEDLKKRLSDLDVQLRAAEARAVEAKAAPPVTV